MLRPWLAGRCRALLRRGGRRRRRRDEGAGRRRGRDGRGGLRPAARHRRSGRRRGRPDVALPRGRHQRGLARRWRSERRPLLELRCRRPPAHVQPEGRRRADGGPGRGRPLGARRAPHPLDGDPAPACRARRARRRARRAGSHGPGRDARCRRGLRGPDVPLPRGGRDGLAGPPPRPGAPLGRDPLGEPAHDGSRSGPVAGRRHRERPPGPDPRLRAVPAPGCGCLPRGRSPAARLHHADGIGHLRHPPHRGPGPLGGDQHRLGHRLSRRRPSRGDRGHRTGDRPPGRRAGHGPDGAATAQRDPARRLSLSNRHRRDLRQR